MERLRVALLFGGRSGEHEVSLRSAESVAEGLSARHEVLPVFIDPQGDWHLRRSVVAAEGVGVTVLPSPTDRGRLRRTSDATVVASPDVYFPVLHGTYGEDGTIQGLLEMAGVAYVGSGVAGSAVAMDKALMKVHFAQAGVPQVPHRVLHAGDEAIGLLDALGLPVFVKPANLGSSVGVSKVKTREALGPALDAAFAFDHKVVVEAGVDAREIEVSVLGNENPEASLPGEIVPDREFYDYDSKYSAESRTVLRIPAALEPGLTADLRAMAVRAFRATDAAGMARVDFFLEKGTGRILVNEINTIPGFTSISMYPKLWAATGLAYGDLLDRLLELGLERHRKRTTLRTRYHRS